MSYEKVIIVAGHSDTDQGAVADDGTTERSITKAVAEKVLKKLRSRGHGVGVTESLSLVDKISTVNDYCNDNELTSSNSLLVSIHCDYSLASAGVGVYYDDGNNKSKALGSVLYTTVSEYTDRDERFLYSETKSRYESLGIISSTIPTAVLVEVGSLSEPDLTYIKSDVGQNDIAEAIVEAICSYTDWQNPADLARLRTCHAIYTLADKLAEDKLLQNEAIKIKNASHTAADIIRESLD